MRKNTTFKHKHSLGQNFITDESLFETLVTLSGVGANDNVLEIGPGAGGLTKALAAQVRHVTALEIDEALFPILHVALSDLSNVTLIKGDVMRVSLPEITKDLGAFHVVANIPYYLTTPLIELLMASTMPILSMALMVQKEVAERLLSQKGEEGYCPLSLRITQSYDAHIAMDVPAEFFTPRPKVDSAFIVLKKRETPLELVADERLFNRLINTAFAMRRKTLINNYVSAFQMSREEVLGWLESANLTKNARAEELDLKDYANLARSFPNFKK